MHRSRLLPVDLLWTPERPIPGESNNRKDEQDFLIVTEELWKKEV